MSHSSLPVRLLLTGLLASATWGPARAQDARELTGAVVREGQELYLDTTDAARRVRVLAPPPALAALVGQTIRVRASFVSEIDGALGEGAGPGEAGAARAARVEFLDPRPETVRGQVRPGRSGAVLVDPGAAEQSPAPGGLRLEGERSLLLLASVQGGPVELEGWRFAGARPFLVSGLVARVATRGYLSVARREDGELAYQKTADVSPGERLLLTGVSLHRRGDAASPFRDLSELELASLDVDGRSAGDEDLDVLMAFARTGPAAGQGFIPLRKLDLGTPERQRALAAALVGVDTAAPSQGGIIRKVKPAVR